MNKKFWILFLIACTVGAAQSTLTTPANPAQPDPGTPATNVQDAGTPATRGQDVGKPRNAVVTGPATEMNDVTLSTESSKFAGPLKSKSDFQLFAEEAAGRPLQVYGRRLFDEVPTTFAPVEHIPVPANYVIGPGDELLIRAWGKIDLDSRVTVDRNGQISLPKVGTVIVAGLRYDELESHLRASLG